MEQKDSKQEFSPLPSDAHPSWPLNKISANYSKELKGKKPLCVLLTTGALCPIHKGHIDIMERAKKAMETDFGYSVLGGWVSPSHDLYVGPKMKFKKQFFASAFHRVNMARILTRSTDWLDVATWESRYSGRWPDFPEVVTDATETVNSAEFVVEGGRKVDVIYVCGTDHARLCSNGFHGANQGLAVVRRGSQGAHPSDPKQLVFGVKYINKDIEMLSSTKVRLALAKNNLELATKAIGCDIIQYCKQHKIFNQTLDPNPTPNPTALSMPPLPIQCARIPTFISCSTLGHQWKSIPKSVLQSSLFFFGSKRKWLFPSNRKEEKEAKEQPGRYHLMDPEFLSLVKRKDAKGQVCFLKSPDLDYNGYPGPKDPKAYERVSDWLKGVKVGNGDGKETSFKPLLLNDSYWDKIDKKKLKYATSGMQVVSNYKNGFHDYNEVMELLLHSNPDSMLPVCRWHDKIRLQK